VISEDLASSSRTHARHARSAKKVRVEKENTTIIDGAGKKADIEGRITQIRAQIEETTSDYDREKLQERLAKLAGGVAVIRSRLDRDRGEGAQGPRRRRDACDRAAVEEAWFLARAALLYAIKALDKLTRPTRQKVGIEIVRRRSSGRPADRREFRHGRFDRRREAAREQGHNYGYDAQKASSRPGPGRDHRPDQGRAARLQDAASVAGC